MSVVLDGGSNKLPLFVGWVTSSWVVSTWVEKEDTSSWGSVHTIEHSIDVQSLLFSVPVWIQSVFHLSVVDQSLVVSPGWVWDVDWSWSVLPDELEAELESSGS